MTTYTTLGNRLQGNLQQTNNNWKCGSSGRMPALQAQSPEFKPQSHKRKKRRQTTTTNPVGLGTWAYNPSTQESGTGKFEASLGYITE
jgi:hypothetical protein